MKKKPYYLKFYKKCLGTGRLPLRDNYYEANGLCCVPGFENAVKTFTPTSKNARQLKLENMCTVWWASGLPPWHEEVAVKFTPLRQTIVLFLAAMNDEL